MYRKKLCNYWTHLVLNKNVLYDVHEEAFIYIQYIVPVTYSKNITACTEILG